MSAATTNEGVTNGNAVSSDKETEGSDGNDNTSGISQGSLDSANSSIRRSMQIQSEALARKKAKKAQRLAEHKAKYG